MSGDSAQAPFRLQLREKGDWYVAYLAVNGKPPLEISRISMQLIRESETIQEDFTALASASMKHIVEKALGKGAIVGYSFSTPSP